MKREDVLSVLFQHRAELQRLGVQRAALFGSVARGTQNPSSDIDILVHLDKAANLGVFEFVGIVQFIESLFNGPVDVANATGLKISLRPRIEREAIYAF